MAKSKSTSDSPHGQCNPEEPLGETLVDSLLRMSELYTYIYIYICVCVCVCVNKQDLRL